MAQQGEGVAQLARPLRRQSAGRAERLQRRVGVAPQHLGRPRRFAQHQVLHQEFEIHEPAAPVAQIPRRGTRGAFGDAAAHVGDFGDEPLLVARRGQRRRDRRGDTLAQRRIAGNRPRPGQRHMLPGPRRFALILGKGGKARRDRPGFARRPQPHVDRIEAAFRGRRGDRRYQALAEPRVIGRESERARPGRAGAFFRRIVDQDQIEVGS